MSNCLPIWSSTRWMAWRCDSLPRVSTREPKYTPCAGISEGGNARATSAPPSTPTIDALATTNPISAQLGLPRLARGVAFGEPARLTAFDQLGHELPNLTRHDPRSWQALPEARGVCQADGPSRCALMFARSLWMPFGMSFDSFQLVIFARNVGSTISAPFDSVVESPSSESENQ